LINSIITQDQSVFEYVKVTKELYGEVIAMSGNFTPTGQGYIFHFLDVRVAQKRGADQHVCRMLNI